MEYDIVIGLEVHAELKTKSKVFCSCKNQFGSTPNSNCCPVCIGLPGALPVLNKKAVELVIKAGLCMDCEINDKAVFERKNYFYPDLAKAYQISQLVKPICVGGKIELKDKTVRLNRIHLEEDAGKLVHSSRAIGTLIDYNRGGVPLMELVTEPDISSAEEAVEFLTKLRSILIYSNVADCKMEEGGMRCDVNLSIKPKGSSTLGVRSEMKNLNSFKSVYRAIKFESQRQINILEQGGKIVQETRKWDDNKERSFAMRKKETSQDYRYFPDPDMLAVNISRELVSNIKDSLPELADQRFKRYLSYSLTEYESEILTRDKTYSDYFDKALSVYFEPKTIANWFLTDVMSKLKGQDEIKISPEDLALIIKSVDDKVISSKVSKEIFEKAWEEGQSVEKLIKELSGHIEGVELEQIIKTLISENEKAVSDYKTTDQPEKVLRWFMGQVMKLTKGKANATQAEALILELLK